MPARSYSLSFMDSREPTRRRSHPRTQLERRAYRLVLGGAVSGVVALVGALLAIAGVVGAGMPVLAVLVALILALLFWRTVAPKSRY